MNDTTYTEIKIGIIGTGWIGGSYAKDFIDRGYNVIQYSLDPEFVGNKNLISTCDYVFIAVPTPTTPNGFDYSIVEDVLSLVGDKKVAVIKSTILPGTTERLQKKFPNIVVMHSPEFLREESALFDVKNPERNIIGYVDERGYEAAKKLMVILPKARFEHICLSEVAEAAKYMGNFLLYLKVLGANIIYDFCQLSNVDYGSVRDMVKDDSRIGSSHLDIQHKSGRGAGGHCFPKDSAAIRTVFDHNNSAALGALLSLENYNKSLLISSNKDLDILNGIYGDE